MYTKKYIALATATSLGVGVFIGKSYENLQFNNYVDDNRNTFNLDSLNLKKILSSVQASSNLIQSNQSLVEKRSINEAISKFGFPSFENIRSFDDYILSYDKRNRTANWVFEHLTKDKVKYRDDIKRQDVFCEDNQVHKFFRATNEDYKGSGYDRGHLAAASNHRWSQQAMNQTFSLSNISPQVGKGFNRDGWNTLEKQVRNFAKHNKNVYVFTGPLYLPKREDGKMYVKYEVIGKNHVAVPTHFFKVVICESEASDFNLWSFVMPNKVLPEKIDIKNYFVPVESIERASGLLILDKLPKARFKKINGCNI